MTYATLTYGTLPTRNTFDLAYMAEVGLGKKFKFDDNEILGNAILTQEEVWGMLLALVDHEDASAHWKDLVMDFVLSGDEDDCLSMASDILASLKIEWI